MGGAHSETAQQKHFFDEHFGPFYRSEQVFISLENGESPINYDTLAWWLDVERQVAELKTDDGVALKDVCFAPTGEACAVQSVSAWMGDIEDCGRDGWKERFESCAQRPGECLPDFGQPIEPRLVLGGPKDTGLAPKRSYPPGWSTITTTTESLPPKHGSASWSRSLARCSAKACAYRTQPASASKRS